MTLVDVSPSPLAQRRAAVLRTIATRGHVLTLPEVSRRVDQCRSHAETAAAVRALVADGRLEVLDVGEAGWRVPGFRLAPPPSPAVPAGREEAAAPSAGEASRP